MIRSLLLRLLGGVQRDSSLEDSYHDALCEALAARGAAERRRQFLALRLQVAEDRIELLESRLALAVRELWGDEADEADVERAIRAELRTH